MYYDSPAPQRLLQTVGGKTVKRPLEPSRNEKEGKSRPKFKIVPELTDLPLSTDDEEEEEEKAESSTSQSAKAPNNSFGDSSEDELSARGNIQSTAFKSNQEPKGRKLGAISGGKGELLAGELTKRKSQYSESTSASRQKRSRQASWDQPSSVQGSQGSQESNFLSSQSSHRRPKATYGSKTNARARGSQDPMKVPKRETSAAESESDDQQNQQITKTRGKKGFKEVENFSDTPKKKIKTTFRAFSEDSFASPEKKKGKLKVRRDELDSDGSSTMTLSPARRPKSKTLPVRASPNARQTNAKLRKGKEKEKGPTTQSPEYRTPKPKFRAPLTTPERDLNATAATSAAEDDGKVIDESFDLSDAEDNHGDARSDSVPTNAVDAPSEPPVTLCPWCKEPVPKAFFQEFFRGKRQNVTQQTAFCRRHKKRSALDMWAERGYPTIQWGDISTRLDAHSSHILGIINGAPCHFGDKLARNIEQGRSRALKQEDNLYPGYYGPRGFNVMCDHLVLEYSDLLKEKAIENRVISGRGSAAFIQAVLVPEVAVRLIMEDMQLGEESARQVMEESKGLGEMIHEGEG